MLTHARNLRIGRILVGVCVFWNVVFAALTVWLIKSGQEHDLGRGTARIVLGVLLLLFLSQFSSVRTHRRVMVKHAGRNVDWTDNAARDMKLSGDYLTHTVVVASLFEGPALGSIVIVFLSGEWLGLILGGLCTVCVARAFPSPAGLERFTRDVAASNQASQPNTLRP